MKDSDDSSKKVLNHIFLMNMFDVIFSGQHHCGRQRRQT